MSRKLRRATSNFIVLINYVLTQNTSLINHFIVTQRLNLIASIFLHQLLAHDVSDRPQTL